MDNIELYILLYHTLICLSLKIYLFNKIGHEIIFYKIKSILITGNKSSNLKTKSSRRLIISWLADLSHHRAYRSVHGGSLVFAYFQIELCECWASKFTEFLMVLNAVWKTKYPLQYQFPFRILAQIHTFSLSTPSFLSSLNFVVTFFHCFQ